MKIIKIEDLNIPETVKKILKKENYVELYPPQAEAIEAGVLEGKNLVLAIPTASGKTLISELAMLKSIIEKNGKAAYLVPLRALASEKYENFKKWEEIGIKINISTSDYDQKDPWLKKSQLIISTNEKFDSLFRHQADWIKDITVFVFDEVHLLHDLQRGPTLEILMTKVKQFNKKSQIIALSATVKNAKEIADWLDASVIISDWRPVALKEGVYFDGTIFFPHNKIELSEISPDPIVDIGVDTVKDKKQALIFTDTRRAAVSLANRLSNPIYKKLTFQERKALEIISKNILSVGGETQIRKKLAEFISKGVAFHHAGLITAHRKIIENAFKDNMIKILTATPTLAAGVNLPARRVIISKYSRYDANFGLQEIPILEYKQFAGRAGRPKYDTEGESILIASNEDNKDYLFEKYIFGETEPIHSRLAQESILRTHILAFIAMGNGQSKETVQEFIGKTFFAHQSIYQDYHSLIDDVIDFLLEENLIIDAKHLLNPTRLGKRISQLYIDPKSGIVFKHAIENLQDNEINTIGILHLIARTQDIPKLYLRKRDYEYLMKFANEHRDEFFFDLDSDEDLEWTLSEIKVASMIYSWINEIDEDNISSQFGIGPGDIHRYVDLYDWLIYSLQEIAKLYKKSALRNRAKKIQVRIKQGVKEELLELVGLKGIGRVRARILYANGYKSVKDLKNARQEDLMKLNFIGPEIIKSIFDQIGVHHADISPSSKKDQIQKSIDDYL